LQPDGDDVSDFEIQNIQRQLLPEEEEDFFVSSEYKKPEIVSSSDEEESSTEDIDKEIIHEIVKSEFIKTLSTGNSLDLNNPVFNNLAYSDQLEILSDVKEAYKFDRGKIEPYQGEASSSKGRREGND
jgi:hypothetical protein